jgi:hypothetical protein
VLGTLGEYLVVLPGAVILYFIPFGILRYFEIYVYADSILWRGSAAVITGALFSFVGTRYGLILLSKIEKWPTHIRALALVSTAIIFLFFVYLGRNIRIH